MTPFVLAALLSLAPDDLSALAQQKSWAELLEKAEGTAPAARDDRWRALVAEAATFVTQPARAAKDPFATAEKADALAERFPFLARHPPFVAARDAAVVAGLERCVQSQDDDCFRRFAPFETTLAPAGSLAAGKVFRRGGFFAWRPIALFARAVGAKDAPACADPDVAEAALAALDTPEGSEAAVAARQVAFDWCFAALKAPLQASMRGAGPLRLANACGPMRARKALTALQDDLCRDVGL